MKSDSILRHLAPGMSSDALERLIYVVGSARGGTTLTKNIIGLHENVVSFTGPTHFLNHPWRHRRRVDERLWRVIFWLPDSIRRDIVRESLEEDRRTVYVRHLNRVLEQKDFRELYQLYPLVRALDPEQPGNQAKKLAWLDKGNDFRGVDLLLKKFPKARLVFVVRDPRGCVASLSKRIADARADTEMKVEPRDIIVSAIYWRNLAQQALRLARRYRERTIFLHYEDLITQSATAIPRIYEILGLPPMSEAVLREKLETVTYGASLDSGERGLGLSTRPLERWRDILSDEAVEVTEEICGPTARRFGYTLSPLSRRRGAPAIAQYMPKWALRAEVGAKLLYLDLRERELSSTGECGAYFPVPKAP